MTIAGLSPKPNPQLVSVWHQYFSCSLSLCPILPPATHPLCHPLKISQSLSRLSSVWDPIYFIDVLKHAWIQPTYVTSVTPLSPLLVMEFLWCNKISGVMWHFHRLSLSWCSLTSVLLRKSSFTIIGQPGVLPASALQDRTGDSSSI